MLLRACNDGCLCGLPFIIIMQSVRRGSRRAVLDYWLRLNNDLL